MDISQIFQALRLGTKAYAVATLTSAAILAIKAFWPTTLEMFGAADMVEKYLPVIFFAFLLSTSALVVSFLSVVFTIAAESWISRKELNNRQKLLHCLSSQEREFLAWYLENDQSTQRSTHSDGVANGLQAKGIVLRTSIVSSPGDHTFPYNIQPWAINYLKKNKNLLYAEASA